MGVLTVPLALLVLLAVRLEAQPVPLAALVVLLLLLAV